MLYIFYREFSAFCNDIQWNGSFFWGATARKQDCHLINNAYNTEQKMNVVADERMKMHT